MSKRNINNSFSDESKLDFDELKQFLDEKVELYNRTSFIEDDPISIPHQFDRKEDIEIAAFLVSSIAWGNRKMIIRSGERMMDIMDHSPFEFVKEYSGDNKKLAEFKHRTFNGFDLEFFIRSLQNIYLKHGGLEEVFSHQYTENVTTTVPLIEYFRSVFFEIDDSENLRTKKHVSSPAKGSAAKRINMYLRWMVREDNKGVDFGIWDSIPTSVLSCPLDVHSGNVARALGLLTRKQNDLKALLELDNNLRKMDVLDPVKYDFALFGLGVFEKFK